ncbi:MAG: VWA domain-containing protein [Ignavibacteriales bacterium]|nr:VWA domain-containing protein [Ignavibacteriales bacterium]MCF8306318.1 VWA domain-containing protein [Ignavibacteriales bacterium]MCF8316039.1 VWA domain-containing protein [Ignavibacteriales bacterium]MCF8437633.1 VWA domain-containing protein [Ignavibacteriales bacterium]
MSKERPGGPTSKRTSPVYFACDTSESMSDNGKITELNNCLREAIPHMQKLEDENPGVEIQMNVLSFNTKAEWVIQNKPVKDFIWTDLKAKSGGETNVGEAFAILEMQMKNPDMPERGFPPLICLITDGFATDSYKPMLDAFLSTKWGYKSIRHSIAIGKDADSSVLTKFINNPEIRPLQANNPEQLAKAIRFVSTVALKKASVPTGGTTPVPAPPVAVPDPSDDVW